MADAHDIWTCPHCGTRQDISHLGFYVEIACPDCGARAFVHGLLANYKIDSILGIGGMSVVFRARDMVLGRPLAIKVLNDTYRDEPERIEGFENECALMAKVRHENVVSVYSAGWARGQFYIAMELVDGRNLELIVAERGFLLPADALEIVRQVALGLQAANEAGLLHRDVKPGNVLITPEGQAKVLDFGLSLEDKPGVETEDVIWATPYYVPPETLHRQPESVQTDIYALGMTLRNLLTGESTLPGIPQTLSDMVVAKKTLPGIATVSPRLEPRLCELVDRMTAYEVADRPSGYDELLQEIAEAQAALAEALDPEERARRYRRKLYAAACGLGSIAAGAVGGFLIALMTPSDSVQQILDADRLQWEERDAYTGAYSLLRDGKYEEAYDMLGSLCNSQSELSLAAAATFVRTALDVLDDKSTENGFNRFDKICSTYQPSSPPPGNECLQMLRQFLVERRMSGPLSRSAVNVYDIGDPMLKVAAAILEADRHVHLGEHAQAAEKITLILENLESLGLASLSEKVDEYRMAAPRRAARIALGNLKKLYHAGNLEAANSKVEELLKQKLGRLEKEEIRVLNEAATIMIEARNVLQKKNRSAVKPRETADELRRRASAIPEAGLFPRELYSLALLLNGNYNEAFKANPYAAEPTSNEPFAVIMRDWKKRLEK